MLIRIDPRSAVPLYSQIASAVREAVASGEVAEGERLPPARALARSLDVNMHTVLRAYGDLRDEGLIELRRGRGAVVTSEDGWLDGAALRLVAEAQRRGLDQSEVLSAVRRAARKEER